MRELIPELDQWLAAGEQVAVATVVQTMGSSPRQVGAMMAVTASGRMAGSVSGGCVEGAVVEQAQTVLASGQARLLTFGVSDETAWEVGLACGGTIEVLVAPLDTTSVYPLVRAALLEERAIAVATVIAGDGYVGAQLVVEAGGRSHGTLGRVGLDQTVSTTTTDLLAHGTSRIIEAEQGAIHIFVASFNPPAKLFLVGGVHIAVGLATMAQLIGMRTIVIDARPAFASPERFAHVDELIVAWPDEALTGRLDARSAVAVLTHDPKLDDPALRVALQSPARYIGALGSTKTHARRLERLRAEGFDDAALSRIKGPIGLAIGAKTPAEIAVSILAEIISLGNKASDDVTQRQGFRS
ncbi:XdhC/CoxI family protein [Candidatus Chloroploca sp. Khr17]|uniref:XdhC family protein n=1 Tax=Candidatus Chloroploca sp. Khr17 TaxID=2496869 RepID=UPI00101CEDE9|nr:XdhC/CoxI family protein [Candidatus Chloroploca sp. Khr17]